MTVTCARARRAATRAATRLSATPTRAGNPTRAASRASRWPMAASWPINRSSPSISTWTMPGPASSIRGETPRHAWSSACAGESTSSGVAGRTASTGQRVRAFGFGHARGHAVLAGRGVGLDDARGGRRASHDGQGTFAQAGLGPLRRGGGEVRHQHAGIAAHAVHSRRPGPDSGAAVPRRARPVPG